jgi:hypothetical protein
MAAVQHMAAEARLGRPADWSLNAAINIDESRKIFYTYREVLLVLIGAVPASAHFLGFLGGVQDLLIKEGDISPGQFDRAIWLICHAMSHFDKNSRQLEDEYTRETATARDAEVQRAAAAAARGAQYILTRDTPFISSFDDLTANRGDITVIAKSLTRIIIRFLFALSLNIRGIQYAGAVPAAAAPPLGQGQGEGEGEGEGPPAVVTAAAVAAAAAAEAEQQATEIKTALAGVTVENHQVIFGEIASVLEKFNKGISDMFEHDKIEIETAHSMRLQQNKLGGVLQALRRNMDSHVNKLKEKATLDAAAASAHKELVILLADAGHTFQGVKPIQGLQITETKHVNPSLIRELIKKQVLMESSIKKLLDKPVAIQDSPSLQAFLILIGLIDAKSGGGAAGGGAAGGGAAGGVARQGGGAPQRGGAGDDDDEDDEVGRLRALIESLSAASQCEQSVGRLRDLPDVRCYICQGLWVDKHVTMECEHIFCIGLAIEYFGLLRSTFCAPDQKLFLSILYAWAHRCCNRLKSNMSFMKLNPNYTPRGNHNFFMFHEVNAAKLLGKIYDNNASHDCKVVFDKKKINKQNFVKSRTEGISAHVMPLVNFSNQTFTTMFSESTVLLTAMGCFKNMASLLVSLNGNFGGNTQMIGYNPDRMAQAFRVVNPGILEPMQIIAHGGRRRKNRRTIQKGGTTREEALEIIRRLAINSEQMTATGDSQGIYESIEPEAQAELLDTTEPSINRALFKLASITNGLNPHCLYGEILLLATDDQRQRQESIIRTFHTICQEFTESAPATVEDASILMLYYISRLSDVTATHDQLNQFVVRIRGLQTQTFIDFFTKCNSVHSLLLHTAFISDDQHENLYSQFLQLCLLRPSSLQTCYSDLFLELSVKTEEKVEPKFFLGPLILEFNGIVNYQNQHEMRMPFKTYCSGMRLFRDAINMAAAMETAAGEAHAFLEEATTIRHETEAAFHKSNEDFEQATEEFEHIKSEPKTGMDDTSKLLAAENHLQHAKSLMDTANARLDVANKRFEKATEEQARLSAAAQALRTEEEARLSAAAQAQLLRNEKQQQRDLEEETREPEGPKNPKRKKPVLQWRKGAGFDPHVGDEFNPVANEMTDTPPISSQSEGSLSPRYNPRIVNAGMRRVFSANMARVNHMPMINSDDEDVGYVSDSYLQGGSSTRRRRKLRRNHRRTQYTNKHKRASSKTTNRTTIKRRKSYRKYKHTVKRRKSRRHN